MTENGDPYENAVAERVNGILKDEYDLYDTFEDFNSAHEAVKVAIEKYNNHRPHRSCNMLTPAEAHRCKGVLKKHWKKKEYQLSGKTGVSEESAVDNRDNDTISKEK